MPRLLPVILASAACGFLPPPIQAQRGDVRLGPWVSAGVAAGSARIDCSACTDASKLGIAGSLQAGGTPSEQFSLGVEGIGWRAAGADTTRELLTLMAVVYYYPSVDQGLFLKAGGGGARYAERSPAQTLSSNGFALEFTLGYEIRMRRTLWIVPYGNYFFAPGHSVKRNQFALVERLQFSMLQLGIGVTWRKL